MISLFLPPSFGNFRASSGDRTENDSVYGLWVGHANDNISVYTSGL